MEILIQKFLSKEKLITSKYTETYLENRLKKEFLIF